MRLINTQTMELEEHFHDNVKQKYAILSHTWGDDEVSYQEFTSSDRLLRSKAGWAKIVYTCTEAKNAGLKYAWVDTCCIDKSSSAELSESINSMYKWYAESACCYVYLSDVSSPPWRGPVNALLAYEDEAPSARLSGQTLAGFRSSRWHKRGWCLQEILAPCCLRFYSCDWFLLGQTISFLELPTERDSLGPYQDSDRLLDLLSEITSIPAAVLGHVAVPQDYSVAQRMSWAAGRSTSREEDQAYCLLGLFDVNMPLLYGEGKKAFRRLQEQIVKETYDQSIFAWEELDFIAYREIGLSELFAPSAKNFADCGDVVTCTTTGGMHPYHLTNRGLDIGFFHPHDRLTGHADQSIAGLQCRREDDFSHVIALWLSPVLPGGGQTVEWREFSAARFRRRTTAIRLDEKLYGPVQTTLLTTGSPGRGGLLPYRLIVETSPLMSDPVTFTRLEPSGLWNTRTLVLTPPKSFAARISYPPTTGPAFICFRYREKHFMMELEYGLDCGIQNAGQPREIASPDITCPGAALAPTRENEEDERELCCHLQSDERLGQMVMVLTIRPIQA